MQIACFFKTDNVFRKFTAYNTPQSTFVYLSSFLFFLGSDRGFERFHNVGADSHSNLSCAGCRQGIGCCYRPPISRKREREGDDREKERRSVCVLDLRTENGRVHSKFHCICLCCVVARHPNCPVWTTF